MYQPDVIHPPCQCLKMYRNCLLRGMIRVWGLLSNRNLYYIIPFIRAKLCSGYGSIGSDPHNAYKMQLIVLWVLIGTEKKIFYGEFIQHGLPLGRSAINRMFAAHIQKCNYYVYMPVTCLFVLLFFSSSQNLCSCMLIVL